MSDSTVETTTTIQTKSDPTFLIADDKNHWFDRWCEKIGDNLSSILVKETRQAVKSRQFFWSYILLIVAVTSWTCIGIAIPEYERARVLLAGYLIILGFPLGIIIPFSAYRSLAREFEDGTIQLISITTMKPYQIVVGKFASAILQLLTYLAILAPCILFTNMLPGISFNVLVFSLILCVCGSITLINLGLFLAGAFRSRTLSVGVSLLLVLALGFSYFLYCIFIGEQSSRMGFSFNFQDKDTQLGLFAGFGSGLTSAALFLVAAASQISFPSDNRSTLIRIVMLVQLFVFVGFVAGVLDVSGNIEVDMVIVGATMFLGHYWLIMGFLMTGETGQISERVRRSLPKTTFGRSFFSLLMPGPGRGYLFAMSVLWGTSLVLILLGINRDALVSSETLAEIRGGTGGSRFGDENHIIACLASSVFVTFFVSLNFVFTRMMRKRSNAWGQDMGPFVSLISGLIFFLLITIGSVVLNALFYYNDFMDEVPLGLNWYYLTIEVGQGSNLFDGSLGVFAGLTLITIGLFVYCVRISCRELLYSRILVPDRVKIEQDKEGEKSDSNVPEGESIEDIFGRLDQPPSEQNS
ncbi:MAG: hypothetical protein AAF623_14800 [Planctomycetota bacterium]